MMEWKESKDRDRKHLIVCGRAEFSIVPVLLLRVSACYAKVYQDLWQCRKQLAADKPRQRGNIVVQQRTYHLEDSVAQLSSKRSTCAR